MKNHRPANGGSRLECVAFAESLAIANAENATHLIKVTLSENLVLCGLTGLVRVEYFSILLAGLVL